MARSTRKQKTFPSALVPFVLALVRARGGDAGRLEKRYLRINTAEGKGLPEISLADLNALLADAAKLSGDPLFGLHAALAMPRGSYGLLEFALRSAPTGLVALEQLARFGPLINPLVRWTLEEDADEVAVHHRAPRKDGVGLQGNHFTVARILAISRQMLGDDLNPTRAWFAHREKDCPKELREHLRCDHISFGQTSNGLAFARVALDRSTQSADPELNRVLEGHASALLRQTEDDEVFERTRRAIFELLPRGDASLARIARRLHLTPRTLQRRLVEEGAPFAGLLTQVRREQAEKLLRRGEASLDEIARSLGYAETGTFVRAFRTWTGTTPGKFRDQRG